MYYSDINACPGLYSKAFIIISGYRMILPVCLLNIFFFQIKYKAPASISIKLSDNDISKNDNKSLMKPALPSDNGQTSLFSLEKNQGYIMTENEKRSIGMLRDIKPEEITPIEAMNTLFELKKLLK